MAVTVGPGGAAVVLLVVAAGAAGCSDPAPALPEDWVEVSAADVSFDVPAGWEAVPNDTDGFAAGMWTGASADDGTRVAISIDVACTADPDDDAEAALDRYLDGPQWRGHEVIARSTAEVRGAATAARSVSRYVLTTAATGRDTEVTRHAVMAVRDGVAALLLVEGVETSLPTDLPQRVRESLDFAAATAQRVAACDAARRGGGSPTEDAA